MRQLGEQWIEAIDGKTWRLHTKDGIAWEEDV